jgi:hypothetical protein
MWSGAIQLPGACEVLFQKYGKGKEYIEKPLYWCYFLNNHPLYFKFQNIEVCASSDQSSRNWKELVYTQRQRRSKE